MNPILNLKIGDFMISDLVFYDVEEKDNCLKLCNSLGISSMPNLDRKSYCSIEGGKFKNQKLVSEQHFRTYDLLFDKKTVQKFKLSEHNVLFVLNEYDEIVGVIHFSDYNSDKMYLHFYKYMMLFEKNLRKFLKSRGHRNAHFIDYIKEKLPKQYNVYFPKDYPEKCVKMDKRIQKLDDFEAFNLSDVMNFANAKEKTGIKDEVKDIRNWAAHFSSAVGFESDIDGKILYKIEDLESFIINLDAFCSAYKTIEMKLLQQTNTEKIQKMIKQYGKN